MRIGVDLGGTKIEAIALRDDGSIAVRERVPTPKDDAEAIVRAVRDLVLSVERAAGWCLGPCPSSPQNLPNMRCFYTWHGAWRCTRNG